MLLHKIHNFTYQKGTLNMLQTPKKFIYGFGLLFAAVLFTHSVCYGAKSVQLTSETHFRCPLLIHWLEDNPGKEESDAPLQYRSSRKTVGIGETVNLWVEGDNQSIGDFEKVEWTIAEGADRAVFWMSESNPDAEGKTTFIGKPCAVLNFYLGDSSADNRKVRVVVKMTTGISKEIEFRVRTPDGKFLSRHKKPPKAYFVVPEEEVGTSAELRIYPTPGEASFSGGVGLLEKDGGSPVNVFPGFRIWRKKSAFINFKHDPPKEYFRVGRLIESGMVDNVGFQRRRGSWFEEWFIPYIYFDYRDMSIRHSAFWICDWYWRDVSKMVGDEPAYDEKTMSHGTKMQPVYQRFWILNDKKGTGVLTKFQSKVKRVAKGNKENKQEYSQTQNP